MSRHKCTKELYRAFLQASSVRYSGKALSEVAPDPLSHDSVSRWLQSQHFRPRGIWEFASSCVDLREKCLLICDDTVLDKSRSQKIAPVRYQYSGNVHEVIAGIGLTNLLWHGLETETSVPIDYRVYDKETDGKISVFLRENYIIFHIIFFLYVLIDSPWKTFRLNSARFAKISRSHKQNSPSV